MSIADKITSMTNHLEKDYQALESVVGTVSVNKNIENIAPLLDNLWEELPKVTGSGTSPSISDTRAGKMKLYLSGNTGQDGTPTPDAPQTIHNVNGNNTITTTGKNLLNLEDGTFTDGSNLTVKIENQKVILNGTTSSDYLWLNLTKKDYRYGTPNTSNKPLWFSGAIIKAGTYIGSISDDNITFNVCQSDGSRNGKTNISSSYDICSACLYIGASGTTFNNKEITLQIEKGSTASSIEKYQTTSYPLNLPVGMELNKISTYKDEPFKAVNGNDVYDNLDSATKETLDYGDWYLKKEIGKLIFDGSESWSLAVSGTNTNLYWAQLTYISADVLSNYFTRNDNLYNEDVEGMRGVTSNNRMWFRINKTTASDKDAFKTWLSTHNTIVDYVLSTPTYTKITDSTLLDQLNAVYRANSYKGQTNINQVNNDLPFNLDATALEG